MIKEVKLPEVSDNVETGDVLKVLVNVGDKIEIDQPLVELETDKATFEVPSTESGTVKEINVKQGDTIRIGAVILTLESNGEEKTEEKSDEKTDEKTEDKSDDEKKEKNVEEKKEKGNEKKKEKGKVKEDKEEEEKEGSKEEDKSDEKKDEDKDKNSDEKEEKEKKEESEKKDDRKSKESSDTIDINLNKISVAASPSVRRLARELSVEINSVTSPDESGRITEDDIKKYVKARLSDSSSGFSISQKALPDFSKWGEVEIQPMTKIRAITGEAMTYAWTTIPMVTQFDKADVTQLEEFRKKNLKKVEEAGGHLTITSILVKVCEAALRNFPQFNSSIDLQKKEVVYKKYFNIGVAADTDRGLLVPVIKNADKKTITQISIELKELSEKARNKKITLEEMEGGNFTISNLGGIGGTNFTPIVYSPQVAILGVSRGSKEAVFINDKFEPRLMLPLTLTYDHRIIDGADAARFLRWICEVLENSLNLYL